MNKFPYISIRSLLIDTLGVACVCIIALSPFIIGALVA